MRLICSLMAATLAARVSTSSRLRSSERPPGIADHPGGAAGQRDRPVAGVLEAAEHDQPDQVAVVQARRRRVAAVVEGDRALGQPGARGPPDRWCRGSGRGGPGRRGGRGAAASGATSSPRDAPAGPARCRGSRVPRRRATGAGEWATPMRRSFRTLGCLARDRGRRSARARTPRGRSIPPDAQEIESSTLYAADGTLVYTFHAEENRKVIPLEQIPVHVREAVIAIEDERFYRHNGVDPRGDPPGRPHERRRPATTEQGGSTITQQYVKQEILKDDSPTFERKLQEASTRHPARAPLLEGPDPRALPERHLLRERRLRHRGGRPPVLRQAGRRPHPRGGRAHRRAHPAAERHRPLRRAGGRPRPRRHARARAHARQRHDHRRRGGRGRGHAAASSPRGSSRPPSATRRAYFVEEVKQWILDDPRFGATAARRGVTCSSAAGSASRPPSTSRCRRRPRRRSPAILPDPNGPAASLVSIEPATGYVRAMVGGRDFFGPASIAKLNLATQGARRPGPRSSRSSSPPPSSRGSTR